MIWLTDFILDIIMESLPKEIIINEISSWLLSIDKQILRRINTNFHKLFPYEEIKFNETNIELIHLIKYKKLVPPSYQ